jgi:hypothetical protein
MGGKYLDVESEARPHSQCPHVCLLFLMLNGSAYDVREGEIPVVRTVFEGSPCVSAGLRLWRRPPTSSSS